MKFEINSKNEDGSIVFQGTANGTEASFLLNVGVSYLLAKGAMPLLKGGTEEEVVAEEPEQMQ